MQGNTAASRDEYNKLLELWKDADPDLPAKNEVAAELERIR
jgi:hypothetical protein